MHETSAFLGHKDIKIHHGTGFFWGLSLQESPEVLHDALAILGSKDIKVT